MEKYLVFFVYLFGIAVGTRYTNAQSTNEGQPASAEIVNAITINEQEKLFNTESLEANQSDNQSFLAQSRHHPQHSGEAHHPDPLLTLQQQNSYNQPAFYDQSSHPEFSSQNSAPYVYRSGS